MAVNPITTQAAGSISVPKPITKEDSGASFKQILEDAVELVNRTDSDSVQGNIDLLTDSEANLHTIMINAEKADIALQYMLQVRNKILDAYNEIMRMQI